MEWISVKTNLPDFDVPVLWCDEAREIWIERLEQDGNSWDIQPKEGEFGSLSKPTHWMPLPKPPAT